MAQLKTYVDTLKGFAFKSSWYIEDNGIPIIKASNFDNDKIKLEDFEMLPEDVAQKFDKYKVGVNDVLIQTVGSWPNNPKSVVGKVVRCQKDVVDFLLNQNIVKLIPHNNINKRYLFYLLKDDSFKSYITSRARGAANQASITLEDILSYKINLPPLDTQEKVASIISSYDDLIELNEKRIKILEEMAQRLYTEWFVKFKFPGHEKVKMVDSGTEFGLIPEGWEIKSFYEVVMNFDSKRKPISSMKRSEMKGVFPYYGAAKIIDYIDSYIFDGRYLLVAEDGSVITPDGRPMLQFVDEKFWVSNHAHIVQGKLLSTEILYLRLSNFPIKSLITGAAQPKITKENLSRIQFVVASNDIKDKFEKSVKIYFDQIFNLKKQIIILSKTRDLLIPQLVIGKRELKS